MNAMIYGCSKKKNDTPNDGLNFPFSIAEENVKSGQDAKKTKRKQRISYHWNGLSTFPHLCVKAINTLYCPHYITQTWKGMFSLEMELRHCSNEQEASPLMRIS